MQHKRSSWHRLDYLGGIGQEQDKKSVVELCLEQLRIVATRRSGLCDTVLSFREAQPKAQSRASVVVGNGPDAYPSNPIRPILQYSSNQV